MNEKRKCVKCKLLIDSDLDTCPYCGYLQNNEEIHENSSENNESKEVVSVEKKDTRNFNLFDFEPKDTRVHVVKQIFLFLTGWIGMTIISLLLQYISLSISEPLFDNTRGIGILNFVIYFILFGILSLICCFDMPKLLSTFKKGKGFLTDLGYGGVLVSVSIAVSITFNLIGKILNIKVADNQNETGINSIVSIYPMLSLLIFGFLGPICEEFTYRVGLFGLLKRGNRILAYVLTAVIFGFIHFDFNCLASNNASLIINEFLNLPSYLAAGITLCFIYEKRGFGGSCVAHILNNVISILFTILSGFIA